MKRKYHRGVYGNLKNERRNVKNNLGNIFIYPLKQKVLKWSLIVFVLFFILGLIVENGVGYFFVGFMAIGLFVFAYVFYILRYLLRKFNL